MPADADRLTRAELRLEQHDREHEETRSAIKSMADGIQKLAEAAVRHEQDQHTFGRIFEESKALRDDVQGLRDDLEEYKKEQTQKELAAAKAELADQNKHIWDIRSALLSAVGMLVLWIVAEKLGIHIAG